MPVSHIVRSLALALCVALSGCGAPIQATRDSPQTQTLAEVNTLLGGRLVVIELMNGARISGVRAATVTPYDVRFERAGQPQAVPIEDVEQIVSADGRGAGAGMLFGLGSGAAAMGLGAAVIAVSQPGGITQGLGVSALFTGALVAIPAAVIGGMLGRRVQPDGPTLYRAPLGRYLPVPGTEDR